MIRFARYAAAVALLSSASACGDPSTPTPATPAAGTIVSPADGSPVPQCSAFTGTSSLPDGKTLLLAMKNLDNQDPSAYGQLVQNFGDPTTLTRWRGVQFFGNGDDSVGQHYVVTLVAVDVVAAQDAAAAGTDAAVNALATTGTELAKVTLTRVAGTPADHCAS